MKIPAEESERLLSSVMRGPSALVVVLLAACGGEGATAVEPPAIPSGIRVNQVGYGLSALKTAVAVGTRENSFRVVDETTGMPVELANAALRPETTVALSGEQVRVADFSEISAPGVYHVEVNGLPSSPSFRIAPDAYRTAALTTLKGFYFARASTALEAEYAGPHARAAGHPNTQMPFMTSSFNPAAPKATSATSWDAPKGWYDAGDYGEYVINAGITVGHLLSLHELYPAEVGDDATHIPESGNQKSDLLDEVKWELDWLLRMQDEDGGVFSKLAGATFPGWVAPKDDTTGRFVIDKSTPAALAFAAAAAQAGRVYQVYDPDFATRCTLAASAAYDWARVPAHEHICPPSRGEANGGSGSYSEGSSFNEGESPEVACARADFTDEFAWAAAELLITTRDEKYLADRDLASALADVSVDPVVGTGSVKSLAYWALARTDAVPSKTEAIRAAILEAADSMLAAIGSNEYGYPISVLFWGANSVVANVGGLLVHAAHFSAEKTRYLNGAVQIGDYLLGKNPVDKSFVTGLGSRYPMRPHCRFSEASGQAVPVPGLVVGGPNPGREDLAAHVVYPAGCPSYPARCYADALESFASNENAINYSAPVVFLFGALDAEFGQN